MEQHISQSVLFPSIPWFCYCVSVLLYRLNVKLGGRKPREHFSINASHSLRSVHDAEASGKVKWVVWGRVGEWCEDGLC